MMIGADQVAVDLVGGDMQESGDAQSLGRPNT